MRRISVSISRTFSRTEPMDVLPIKVPIKVTEAIKRLST